MLHPARVAFSTASRTVGSQMYTHDATLDPWLDLPTMPPAVTPVDKQSSSQISSLTSAREPLPQMATLKWPHTLLKLFLT